MSPVLLAFWVEHVYCLLILQCQERWLSLSTFPSAACAALCVLVWTNTHSAYCEPGSILPFPSLSCPAVGGSSDEVLVFSRVLPGSTWSALFPSICERQTRSLLAPHSSRARCICWSHNPRGRGSWEAWYLLLPAGQGVLWSPVHLCLLSPRFLCLLSSSLPLSSLYSLQAFSGIWALICFARLNDAEVRFFLDHSL